MKLNEFIKVSRKEKKLTLIQLASKSDLSYTMLYRVEDGSLENPHPDIIKKICYALQLNYEDCLHLAGYLPTTPLSTPAPSNTSIPVITWNSFEQLNYFQPPYTCPNNLPSLGISEKDALFGIQVPDQRWRPFFKPNDIIGFSHTRPLRTDEFIIIQTENGPDIRICDQIHGQYIARGLSHQASPSLYPITTNHIGTITSTHYAKP